MSQEWVYQLAGRFVVLEGPDGSGKSSQFSRLANLVSEAGLKVCRVREPGGTPLGENIREILLDHKTSGIDLRAEMLLYMASRAQLVHDRICPALERGEFVLTDRFVPSTLVYQGFAGGVPQQEILAAAEIVCTEIKEKLGRSKPDLTVIFDVDEETAAARLNPLLDRMEAKGVEFHRKVRRGYLELAAANAADYVVIDASESEDAVFQELLERLRSRFRTSTG